MKFLLLRYLLVFFGCASGLYARPNFVVVRIDGMGWGDFSCFGNTEAKTPNIDRLAAEGIRFRQFYVNSPIHAVRRPNRFLAGHICPPTVMAFLVDEDLIKTNYILQQGE